MIYLGLVEQRANELLSSYLSLQHHGHTGGGAPWQQGPESGPSGMLIGPNTPQGMSTVQVGRIPPHPNPTPPHLTSPHLTSPHPTPPHLTSPHLTSPHLASPHPT
eukprot:7196042-Prymnesium_polylepis.1